MLALALAGCGGDDRRGDRDAGSGDGSVSSDGGRADGGGGMPAPLEVERIGGFASGEVSVRVQITARNFGGADAFVEGRHGVELTTSSGSVTRVEASLDDGTPIPFAVDDTGMDSAYDGELPVEGTFVFDLIEVGAGNELRGLRVTPTAHMSLHTIGVSPTLALGEDAEVTWSPSGEPGVRAQVELTEQDVDLGFGEDDGVEIVPGSRITTPTTTESVQVERRVTIPLAGDAGSVQLDYELRVVDVRVE